MTRRGPALRRAAARAAQSLAVLLAVSLLGYTLMGLMPGDPIDLMISANPHLTTDDAARLRALHGLDRPLLSRYGTWLTAAAQGDLGYSRLHARPALEVVVPALGRTAVLVTTSFSLAVVAALALGVTAARRPRSVADYAVSLLAFAGVSVPSFWLALLLIALFSVTWGVLPPNALPLGDAGPLQWARHLAMPVATLATLCVAGYSRYVRSAMIETLRQDYIRSVLARGVSETRAVWVHALRNALVPVVTVMALDFGALFSGALVTETVFAYPGMGKLLYDAVMGNDFNLALAGLLAATAAVLAANLASDLACAALDPRGAP